MPKFFIKNNQIENNSIIITGEDVKHISNVLRMKIGEEIQVCDTDTTNNYLVKLQSIQKEKICCEIIQKIESEAESNINLKIFQGIPKSDKMELIIQKSTELGVTEIIPVQMERCVSKITQKDEKRKSKDGKKYQK